MGTEIPVTEICRAEKSALPLFQRDAPSFLWKERRVRVAVPGSRITLFALADRYPCSPSLHPPQAAFRLASPLYPLQGLWAACCRSLNHSFPP